MAVAVFLMSAAVARAQTFSADDPNDFALLASRFVAQIPDNHPVHVGVIPNSDITGQLAAAIRSLKRPTRLRIDVPDATAVDVAMKQVGGAAVQRTALRMALDAGRVLHAEYIVVLTPERGARRPKPRLTLELVDVRNERSLDTTVIETASTAAMPDAVPSQQPLKLRPLPPPQVVSPPETSRPVAPAPSGKPPRLWPSQKIAIISGYALTGLAAGFAMSQDGDVRALRRRMVALPAGAVDEFAQLKDEARRATHTRDFWWSVAAGGAAVTSTYWIVSASSSPAIGFGFTRRF